MLSVSEGGDFSLEAHESWSFFFFCMQLNRMKKQILLAFSTLLQQVKNIKEGCFVLFVGVEWVVFLFIFCTVLAVLPDSVA